MTTQSPIRLTRTTPPAVEPLTTSQAKKQLEIAESDESHDDQIELLITAAREQWEHDTDSATTTQTWTQTFERLSDPLRLTMRPIQSITSVTYYDTGGDQQTAATSIYGLDVATREVRLKYDQSWPDYQTRWDAIAVTFVAGYGDTGASVPAIARQAMLLLVAHYFENRDMIGNDSMLQVRAYDMLVRKFQRSSYP